MPSRSELAACHKEDTATAPSATASSPASEETTLLSRRELANAVRVLSMDAVQRAESGHPGAPMGMADFGTVLWRDFLRHNPANPKWLNRDRVILSNGHGSMLLYSLLHLSVLGASGCWVRKGSNRDPADGFSWNLRKRWLLKRMIDSS